MKEFEDYDEKYENFENLKNHENFENLVQNFIVKNEKSDVSINSISEDHHPKIAKNHNDYRNRRKSYQKDLNSRSPLKNLKKKYEKFKGKFEKKVLGRKQKRKTIGFLVIC